MSDLQVPVGTLDAIRGMLGTARTTVEDTATSAPGAVDAGDMTPLLTAMLSKLTDSTASLSEGLSLVSSQVDDTEADFWTTDASVDTTFTGGGHLAD